MRASTSIHLAITLALAVSLAITIDSSHPSRGNVVDVVALAREMHGLGLPAARDLIQRRFGPANRDVGSGERVEQWDVGGGVLQLNILGVAFTSGDASTRVNRTTNLAGECVIGSYEMFPLTGSYLGTVTISAGGSYHYEPSNSWDRDAPGQQGNFFMLHSDGIARIDYADGVGPDTRLEDIAIADGQRLARVVFTASDGSSTSPFNVIVTPSAMMLALKPDVSAPFTLTKCWVNYWR